MVFFSLFGLFSPLVDNVDICFGPFSCLKTQQEPKARLADFLTLFSKITKDFFSWACAPQLDETATQQNAPVKLWEQSSDGVFFLNNIHDDVTTQSYLNHKIQKTPLQQRSADFCSHLCFPFQVLHRFPGFQPHLCVSNIICVLVLCSDVTCNCSRQYGALGIVSIVFPLKMSISLCVSDISLPFSMM